MRLEIKEIGRLKDAIGVVEAVVSDVVAMRLSSDKIKFQGLGSGSVVWADLEIKRELFSAYEIEAEKELCIVCKDFNYILKKARAGDTLEMIEKDNEFIITLSGASKRVYNLGIVEREYTFQDPKMVYALRIKCNSTTFFDDVGDACDIMKKENGSVEFMAKGDLLQLNASETVRGVTIDVSGTQFLSKSDTSSRYGSAFIENLIEGKKIANDVIIEFVKDAPLRLTYEQDDIKLRFVLAARVAND
jgi:hypothetical protein